MRTNQTTVNELIALMRVEHPDSAHKIFYDWLEIDDNINFPIMMSFVTHLCLINSSCLVELIAQVRYIVEKEGEK